MQVIQHVGNGSTNKQYEFKPTKALEDSHGEPLLNNKHKERTVIKVQTKNPGNY